MTILWPRLQDVTTLMFAVADGLATFDFYESDVNQFDVSHSPSTPRQTLHPKPAQNPKPGKRNPEPYPPPQNEGIPLPPPKPLFRNTTETLAVSQT